MKIEIEFEEVEKLKQQINRLEQEKKELLDLLNKFNQNEINNNITDLAQIMFENVMTRLFNEIGLEYVTIGFPYGINFKKLEDYIGKNWWNSEKLEVTIGTEITNKFKHAILRMHKQIDLQ